MFEYTFALANVGCEALENRSVAMNEHFGSGTLKTLGEAIQELRASETEGDITSRMPTQ